MRQKCIPLVLLCLSTSLFASDECRHYYVGGSAGYSRGMISNRDPQIQYANGTLTDAYPSRNIQANTLIGSLNGGYEFGGTGKVPSVALGLGVYVNPTRYLFRGQLIETPLNDASNLLYNYKYTINTTRVMAEAQFTWLIGNVTPFLNVGLGTSFNHIASYSESVATSDGYVPLPPYQSHTNTNFVYQVGCGIGYAFDYTYDSDIDYLRERVSIGYLYANLGSTSLGTRGSVYPYSINAGNFETNNIYISYTHMF